MKARGTPTKKLFALARGILDPEFHDRGLILPETSDRLMDLLGDLGPTHPRELLDLGPMRDRHDPGNDRNRDANLASTFHKIKIVTVIKKKLGHHRIRAFVDFPFEMFEIFGFILAFRMTFRITRHTEIERLAKLGMLTDEPYEFCRVVKTIRLCFKLRLTLRRITPEGYDILNALGVKRRKDPLDLSPRLWATQVKCAATSRPIVCLISSTRRSVFA